MTKSGTNSFHGSAFEYFRNDKLNANDWFANANRLPRPELRQNDFGGVLGGPIRKDKLFFFGSYEGLRVRQPHVGVTYVPSLASRQNAPSAVQPLLNAFPLPNGADLGNGTAGFTAVYSDPSTLDSGSIKMDYLPTQRVTLFGRVGGAPSRTNQRNAGTYAYSDVKNFKYGSQYVTLGSNQVLSPRMTNEVRVNYSHATGVAFTNSTTSVALPHRRTRFCILPSHRRSTRHSFFLLTPLRTESGFLQASWEVTGNSKSM